MINPIPYGENFKMNDSTVRVPTRNGSMSRKTPSPPQFRSASGRAQQRMTNTVPSAQGPQRAIVNPIPYDEDIPDEDVTVKVYGEQTQTGSNTTITKSTIAKNKTNPAGKNDASTDSRKNDGKTSGKKSASTGVTIIKDLHKSDKSVSGWMVAAIIVAVLGGLGLFFYFAVPNGIVQINNDKNPSSGQNSKPAPSAKIAAQPPAKSA